MCFVHRRVAFASYNYKIFTIESPKHVSFRVLFWAPSAAPVFPSFLFMVNYYAFFTIFDFSFPRARCYPVFLHFRKIWIISFSFSFSFFLFFPSYQNIWVTLYSFSKARSTYACHVVHHDWVSSVKPFITFRGSHRLSCHPF